MFKRLTVIGFLATGLCHGSCDSIRFAASGGWMPSATAPHNGTVVEMMQTFGIAPWYGLFKWSDVTTSMSGHGPVQIKLSSPEWVSADGQHGGMSGLECAFWRPYKKPETEKYTDPTGGAQNSVAYWCAAAHVAYDPKTGYCKK